MRCDTCLNSRRVVSENGIHSVCCLSDKSAVDCITHKKDEYIEHPMYKNSDKESE